MLCDLAKSGTRIGKPAEIQFRNEVVPCKENAVYSDVNLDRPRSFYSCLSVSQSGYSQDLVVHWSIAVGSDRCGGFRRCGSRVKVIGHLRIQLFGSLLGRAGRASATSSAPLASLATSRSCGGVCTSLGCGS